MTPRVARVLIQRGAQHRSASLETDEVEHLDRLLAVRVDDTKTYLPLRPEVFAALPTERRTGTWHLLRADFPNDAFAHVRSHGTNDTDDEPGCSCPVQTVLNGTWDDVRQGLGDVGHVAYPPSIRVPGIMRDASDVGSD